MTSVSALLTNSPIREFLFIQSKFKGMLGEIGSIRNEADETSLQILALFRDSISEIRLKEHDSVSVYFNPEYSHYLVYILLLTFNTLKIGKSGTCAFAGMSEFHWWSWL